MEAIKFSELPSGDKQDLGENDGLPIIANQENRLLSWGRLKKQLAKQTHTNDVKLTDENKEKVPTMEALENRLTGLKDELDERLDDCEAKAEGADATAKSALASAGSASRDAQNAENIATAAKTVAEEAKTEATKANNDATAAIVTANTAKTTADGALEQAETAQTTANSAQGVALNAKEVADSAKSDASRFYSELNGKLDTNTTALQNLRGDLETEATARTEAVANVNSSVQSVASRVGAIETKIASGELGGGTGDGENTPSIDLTPVNNRLTALESKDTEHENRLEALETARTTQENKITALETSTNSISDTLANQATQINELKTNTNITDDEGNTISVADAINEAKQSSADAGAVANTAKTLAEAAQTTANGAQSVATSAQTTASEALTTAETADGKADTALARSMLGNNELVTKLLFCNSVPNDLGDNIEASSGVETERLADTFTNASTTETPNISWLTTILNGNFYRITEVINAMSADLANAGGDVLEKEIIISKGVVLEDDLLNEDGTYAGVTYAPTINNFVTQLENSPCTLDIAINRLYHNQIIMFEMLKYAIGEMAVRKDDVDTVVKNINSVFAQVMN